MCLMENKQIIILWPSNYKQIKLVDFMKWGPGGILPRKSMGKETKFQVNFSVGSHF